MNFCRTYYLASVRVPSVPRFHYFLFSEPEEMRQWLNGWSGPGGGAGAGHGPPVAVPGGAPAPVGPTRGLDDKQSTLSR